MKLSVIIPAYNEINTIEDILKKIEKINIDKEIIIVDDGSTDGTREFLEKIDSPMIKTFFHEKNSGKTAALKTGIRESSGEIIIIQDADLEYEPEDYYNLVKPIQDGKFKVVYGTRFPKWSENRPGLFYPYFFANRILTLMSNILYRANITDEPTCYKVFDAEVLKSINLKTNRFEFCPEVTAKVRKKGYKICEIPIKYYPRSVKEGKKIRFKDGVDAIWTLIKYRFVD